MQIDSDTAQTNLFTVPQEVYDHIYAGDLFTEVYARNNLIIISVAGRVRPESKRVLVRVFVLQHMRLIQNQILSCQLVQDDELVVKAKTVIQTELVRAFSFKDIVSVEKGQEDTDQDRIKKELEQIFAQWVLVLRDES